MDLFNHVDVPEWQFEVVTGIVLEDEGTVIERFIQRNIALGLNGCGAEMPVLRISQGIALNLFKPKAMFL